MEKKAVYYREHDKWFLICVCEQVEDAPDIAGFFQKRDRGQYQYAYTDEEGTIHEAKA